MTLVNEEHLAICASPEWAQLLESEAAGFARPRVDVRGDRVRFTATA